MNRLTTDTPFDWLEVICNMVYPKDGWTYIRHRDIEGEPITDFCLKLCKINDCLVPGCAFESEEEKDEFLCQCTAEGCPIASVYAALSGFSHVRSRLKMYEDAGMMPPVDLLEDKSHERP